MCIGMLIATTVLVFVYERRFARLSRELGAAQGAAAANAAPPPHGPVLGFTVDAVNRGGQWWRGE